VTAVCEVMAPQAATVAPLKSRKPQTKVDRLLAQGRLIEVDRDGRKVPCLKMPTPELQEELQNALEKSIKKHLKETGFERICATQRQHPFHSAILRERVDTLMETWGRKAYRTPEGIEAERQDLYEYARETQQQYPAPEDAWKRFTERDADEIIAEGIKENSDRVLWAKAYEFSREILHDPYWRSTKAYKVMLPPDGPSLPEGSNRPKPVYINKQRPDLVIQLRDSFVNLWIRCE
jgi:hypothetical protein